MRGATRSLSLLLAAVAAGALPGSLFAASAYHDAVFNTQVTSNLVYGTGLVSNGATSANLLLDLYRPTLNPSFNIPLPAFSPGIVLIHGGSFVSGDKADSDLVFLASTYASYGYTVASINYRMYFDTPPAQPGPADTLIPPPPPFVSGTDPPSINAVNAAYYDSQKAMGWMRDNAGTYLIDTTKVGIAGGSAGAITALLEAYNDPAAHIAPQVVVDFLGSMYGTENTIHSGAPPAFIVHGTADTTVPFSGDVAVSNRLTAVGTYNEFYVETGLGHTVNFNLIYGGETLLQRNMEFLAAHLAPEPSSFLLAAMGALAIAGLARRRVRGVRSAR